MPPNFPIYQKPVLLIDFDDTLSEFDGYKGWRYIGPPRDFAKEFLEAFRGNDWIIILWTGRAETGYIREWFHNHHFVDSEGRLLIDYFGVNPEDSKVGMNPSKPTADLIVDNSCYPWFGQPVPLREVLQEVKKQGLLEWKKLKV